ncbi:hypothetical protein [Mycobacteroides chelonae]|uniref:hypothetical protein n=1 Tax=Mycobacteroides chelonae TaxID=1774 RepID=UPI001E310C7F|nr:hypothetical protein [Mycobacteroides chelonae]
MQPWAPLEGWPPRPKQKRWPLVLGLAAVGVVAVLACCAMMSFALMVFLKVRHELKAVSAQADFSKIEGQFPASSMVINPDFPTGVCVHLRVEETQWWLSKAECGAPDDNYIVVQQVQARADCVADADYKYSSTMADGRPWAACLDYHWINDSCLSIGKRDSSRVACDDRSRTGREKPVRLILDTATVRGCPSGGFAHEVRRFTVCTETQR